VVLVVPNSDLEEEIEADEGVILFALGLPIGGVSSCLLHGRDFFRTFI